MQPAAVIDTRAFASRADALRRSLLDCPPRLLPPVPMMRVIGSQSAEHYLFNMQEYAHDLVSQAELLPSSHILDIGSGCGRIASAFTRFLNPKGSYLGIDVWEDGIVWCREHISSEWPNFEFQPLSATNNYYYASDTGQANDFGLSFLPSDRFDCIFALSVFTHLKLVDARQYFEHIARCLTTQGHAYLTFFVIDQHSKEYVRKTGNHRSLAPAGDGMWYAYERQDFFAGYELPLLEAQFAEHGLEVVRTSPGSWAAKPGARLYQDWFLLQRR